MCHAENFVQEDIVVFILCALKLFKLLPLSAICTVSHLNQQFVSFILLQIQSKEQHVCVCVAEWTVCCEGARHVRVEGVEGCN